jgi:ribosomal protein L34E
MTDRAPEFAACCARCGAPFVCGVDEPGGCWCARLPKLPATALAADAGCLCETCLRKALAQVADAAAAR